MAEVWPWLVIAGAGALHGLHRASGWAFAVAGGLCGRDGRFAPGAMLSIALGHLAAIMPFAIALALDWRMDAGTMLAVGGFALVVARLARPACLRMPPSWRDIGQTGIGLWSFAMASLHGAGWMLWPVLGPMCLGAGTHAGVAAPGPLATALLAATLHTAAMVLTAGAVIACIQPVARYGLRIFPASREERGSPSPHMRENPGQEAQSLLRKPAHSIRKPITG